jgi:hypothetical protein
LNVVAEKKVLVFLPVAAAKMLTPRLASAGYGSTVVSELTDLAAELASDRHWLVVAIRQDIDVVRQMRLLPVINIEIFFHSAPALALALGAKALDVDAFLKRVGVLFELMTKKPAIPVVAEGRRHQSPSYPLSRVTAFLMRTSTALGLSVPAEPTPGARG